jgi:hypothetical protein
LLKDLGGRDLAPTTEGIAMTTIIYFTKIHPHPHQHIGLAGYTTEEKISFPTRASAMDWFDSVRDRSDIQMHRIEGV